MYTVLSIIFLCIEVLLAVALGYLIFKKKAVIDQKSLVYLLPVFVLIYLLYLMATVYNGTELNFYVFFLLIHETFSMLAMELNDALVASLSQANPWFYAATIGVCILSFITVVFAVVVLFGAAVTNEWRKRKCFAKGGDIVIGVSPSSLEYVDKNKNTVIWTERLDKEKYLDFIKQGYVIHKAPLTVKQLSKHLKKAQCHLIVFRDTDCSYPSILACFEELKAQKEQQLFLHLEVNADEMGIVREKYLPDVSENANSFVLSFCRYELMARRFLTEHPITKYMPRSFFNDNLTLKEEKNVNVVFLGFGKVNYELFKLMATNFQFAKQKDGKLKVAPVHYYTFEHNDEKFNNEYFIRLMNEYDGLFKHSDLPPAEKICEVQEGLPIDAHSADVRNQIRALVNENSYTYFVVSLADDFQDSAFAHGLKKLLEEETNYKIFVRSKGKDSRWLNKNEDNIVYFGQNEQCFLRENIINDDLMQLSQNVNNLYNDYTQNKWAQLREWQKLPVIEQYSNINAAMHIYFKLHLLGFSLEKNGKKGLSKTEFENLCPNVFMRKKGEEYSYFFGTETANVLAFIEHSRWNAYYLLSGYKPLPFEQFTWTKNNKGKDVLQHKDTKKMRHACLTTYEGLDSLIRHKYKVLKEASETGEKDVGDVDLNALAAIYRYDYMVIDGMYDALTRLGYTISQKTQTK